MGQQGPNEKASGGVNLLERVCTLRITLLGSFSLEIDGVDVKAEEWKSKKALTMFKYLAVKKGHKVSSDSLIELLWPENGGLDSTGNLHTAVWSVRRILQGDFLQYSNGSYWLECKDNCCLDLEEFEWHISKSKELITSDPEQALHHCNSALQLYNEDFLYEDAYDDWTMPFREYYKELYFELVVRTAELLRTYHANYKEAVKVCRGALNRDPYREEIYQVCLKALISDGRYVDAINLYKNYKTLLETEFQIEPSLATQELIKDLARQYIRVDSTVYDLESDTNAEGAYSCGRVTFQALLNIEQRRYERNQHHFSILIFQIKHSTTLMQHHSQEAFRLLQLSSRRTDVICQWSANTVAIFLPETKAIGAKETLHRHDSKLREKFENIFEFSCDILSSEFLRDMPEKFQSIV